MVVYYVIKFVDDGYDVMMLVRYLFWIYDFDSDSGWFGLKYMKVFSKMFDY